MKNEVCIGDVTIPGPAVLAPMAGVTDLPFRKICKEHGAALLFSELVSAQGLTRRNSRSYTFFRFEETERPFGIQLFGSEPDLMAEAAQIVEEFKPDIIDINFGCPVPKVVRKNSGSALLREPKLVGKIIESVVKAVQTPVTAKIRSGWDRVNAVEVARIVEDAGAKAIAVHGRTQKMGFSGKADWDVIASVKRTVSIPVIGNGDIFSAEDAARMFDETGCDLVMIGRGVLGNPWIFEQIGSYLKNNSLLPMPTYEERIMTCLRHFNFALCEKGESTGLRSMRKHIGWYTKGMPNSSEFRVIIMHLDDPDRVREELLGYLNRCKM